MISVSDTWSAEEVDSTRKIVGDLLVSWKKEDLLGNVTFTIGVSTIGGGDVIGANPGAIGSPGQFRYFEESDYLLGMAWERFLSQPVGGLTKALFEAELDNTSGRFLPHYMGGNSELYTSILPRRPFVAGAGFHFEGIDQTIPQFAGVFTKTPKVDVRGREVSLEGADYIDFFQNRYLDEEVMFTSKRSDIVIEDFLQSMGLATSQYELDAGLNIIKFGLFERGSKFSDHIHRIVQAENGHFYQDEEGKLRFENRQHWSEFPHFNVQRDIYTAQVLEAESPKDDHIINVVEVVGTPRAVEANQIVWDLEIEGGGETLEVASGARGEYWVNFNDPMFAVDTPDRLDTSIDQTSYFKFNTSSDDSGTDSTDDVVLVGIDNFAQASKIIFRNDGASTLYLTKLVMWGRPARVLPDVYYREAIGNSITAYEERPYKIENPYIQDISWAESLGKMILNDYAYPENLQKIMIRAIPELQLGDLISWQGRHWRVFGIRTQLNPASGFVQELEILQRTIQTYFRIGISTIGGDDVIAP